MKVPDIGPARAVYYDLAAFRYCIQKIKKEKIEDAVVYVLACRIGPFVGHFKRQLHRLSGTLYVNPDGHEFMRAKWNKLIRKYWKYILNSISGMNIINISRRPHLSHMEHDLIKQVNQQRICWHGIRSLISEKKIIILSSEDLSRKIITRQ